jgi:peptide/nickel transport system substrate-binding protein/oligopeptide transport system substrate-binding protein
MREPHRLIIHRSESRSHRRGEWHSRAVVGAVSVLVGLVPLLLAACGIGAGQGGGLAATQTFTWPYYAGNAADPNHPNIFSDEIFDPAATSYLWDAGTISMLYTNLLSFDRSLHVVPDATTAMPTVDSTGTIYIFHLRPNMHFSDGMPLTAQDFAYGIDRALEPNLCTQLDAKVYPGAAQGASICNYLGWGPDSTGYLGHILGAEQRAAGTRSTVIGYGVKVLDSLTLQILIDKPVQFFLDALTYPTSDPVEKKLVENPAYAGGLWVEHLDQGGCSGPFQVQSYGNGNQLTLIPNPYWEAAWGKHIELSQVVRPAVGSVDAEYQNYVHGQYDYTDVPHDLYSFARAQSDFNELASLQTDFFGLNFRAAPFDDQNLRRAFDLALNKQYLVDSVENGGALPTNHIIPKGIPGYDSNLLAPDNTESITGDQTLAQKLLAQEQQGCGGPDGTDETAHDWCPFITGANPQPINIYVGQSSDTGIRITTQAAKDWNSVLTYTLKDGTAVPLNVREVSVSGATLFGELLGGHNTDQMWSIGWVADYPDPQDWTTLQFSVGAPDNMGNWNISGLDTLLAQADVEPDSTQRLADYNKAEQLIVDACAWIPFQQDKLTWRVRPWVQGFQLNQLELVTDLSWPNVSISNVSSS